jgi:hypothetical protein
MSPLLPQSGHDSRDVPFMANLGSNILVIAFWLTVVIFATRCILSLSARREVQGRGFDVIVSETQTDAAEEPAVAVDGPASRR